MSENLKLVDEDKNDRPGIREAIHRVEFCQELRLEDLGLKLEAELIELKRLQVKQTMETLKDEGLDIESPSVISVDQIAKEFKVRLSRQDGIKEAMNFYIQGT